LKNQILYFEDVNLNENKIKGLGDPPEDGDEANKKYVDAEIAKLPKADTDVLKLNGSQAMKGNLNMGDHIITGIRSSSADNAALTVVVSKSLYLPISGIRGMQRDLNMGKFTIINIKPFGEIYSAQPAQDSEVINFGYFRTQRGLLKTLINTIGSESLSCVDPTDKMEVDLNIDNHYIIKLKEPLPSNLNYAATVHFVNKTVSDNKTTINALIDKKI